MGYNNYTNAGMGYNNYKNIVMGYNNYKNIVITITLFKSQLFYYFKGTTRSLGCHAASIGVFIVMFVYYCCVVF